MLTSYFISIGIDVPSVLLQDGHNGGALQRWASQHQMSLSTHAQMIIHRFGDECMQIIRGADPRAELTFPIEWEHDPIAEFSNLQADLIFFNAALDMHGNPTGDDTLWCRGCHNVTVIDVYVNHMQLLEQPGSF